VTDINVLGLVLELRMLQRVWLLVSYTTATRSKSLYILCLSAL